MVTASNDAPAYAQQQHDIEQEAHHQSNGHAKVVNNWQHPGPAAFDFRSMPASHNPMLCPMLSE